MLPLNLNLFGFLLGLLALAVVYGLTELLYAVGVDAARYDLHLFVVGCALVAVIDLVARMRARPADPWVLVSRRHGGLAFIVPVWILALGVVAMGVGGRLRDPIDMDAYAAFRAEERALDAHPGASGDSPRATAVAEELLARLRAHSGWSDADLAPDEEHVRVLGRGREVVVFFQLPQALDGYGRASRLAALWDVAPEVLRDTPAARVWVVAPPNVGRARVTRARIDGAGPKGVVTEEALGAVLLGRR